MTRRFVIPPKQSATFVARMEDVLAVYRRPIDPTVPLICFDELGKELQADLIAPLPMCPGHPRRIDPGYARHGSASLLLTFAPQLGWRTITVTAQRTHREWAEAMRDLVDIHFPTATKIVVVLDNLNTHVLGSLYHRFAPAEALRIAQKLEFHYTPVHGSWLNMAELEFSALQRMCLSGRRFPSRADLAVAVDDWLADRNAAQVAVDWRFMPEDARSAMPHVYPSQPDNEPWTDYSG